jgi:hypothetical protein
MDELIARTKKMKRLLENADRCKCLDLEDCGKVFTREKAENLNGANGMSDIEGKTTRVGASERRQRTSFKR